MIKASFSNRSVSSAVRGVPIYGITTETREVKETGSGDASHHTTRLSRGRSHSTSNHRPCVPDYGEPIVHSNSTCLGCVAGSSSEAIHQHRARSPTSSLPKSAKNPKHFSQVEVSKMVMTEATSSLCDGNLMILLEETILLERKLLEEGQRSEESLLPRRSTRLPSPPSQSVVPAMATVRRDYSNKEPTQPMNKHFTWGVFHRSEIPLLRMDSTVSVHRECSSTGFYDGTLHGGHRRFTSVMAISLHEGNVEAAAPHSSKPTLRYTASLRRFTSGFSLRSFLPIAPTPRPNYDISLSSENSSEEFMFVSTPLNESLFAETKGGRGFMQSVSDIRSRISQSIMSPNRNATIKGRRRLSKFLSFVERKDWNPKVPSARALYSTGSNSFPESTSKLPAIQPMSVAAIAPPLFTEGPQDIPRVHPKPMQISSTPDYPTPRPSVSSTSSSIFFTQELISQFPPVPQATPLPPYPKHISA